MSERLKRLTSFLDAAVLGQGASGESRDKSAEHLIGPESLGAARECGRRGEYWRRSTCHDIAEPWGEMLPQLLCDDPHQMRVPVPFDGTGPFVPLSKCLFVDCETTGLSGGAGIVSFLTAVGRLTKDGFTVDQYFLPDLAEEAGKLDAIATRFADAEGIITYNGASFDLPLIEGRFRFWRIDSAFRELPHLDLLHPTRALFKGRIGDCSLGNVEERLLRFARIEDLPGAEVPEVYFQYLREGHSPRLHAVFEHNRLDVVSLFVYALWLVARVHGERARLSDPDDLIALARYWFRRRQPAAAHRALDDAEDRVLDKAQRVQVHELRGRIHKREGQYEDAHPHWQELATGDPSRFDAAEELAKHLEHRHRDFPAALKVVDEALERVRILDAVGKDVQDARKRLMHRRTRLLRRLASHGGRTVWPGAD